MYRYFLPLFFVVPVVAVAAGTTIQSILTMLTTSLSSFVSVGVGVALVVFIWGVVQFIYASGDEKAIEIGRQRMVWGIVALFFIVSVWGVVTLLQSMIGVGKINATNNCSAPMLTPDSAKACL